MDFYKVLSEKGLSDILLRVQYQPVNFYNQQYVNNYFDELLQDNNARVLVYGDYDVDGAMFTMTTCSALRRLNIRNYEVFRYRKRTHDLDKEAVRYCIQNKFEYFIIGDTASSSLNVLKQLVSYGIKVLVIDHHMTQYDYDAFANAGIVMLNSTIENNIAGKELYNLSAGALAFCVYDAYFRVKGFEPLSSEAAYALVSLYADCMNMSNILNRGIYYTATELPRGELPKYILHFMSEYQSLNARFIGFWFAPRINALFRSERFEILNQYLFDDIDTAQRVALIEQINEVYSENRKMVNILADLVEVENLEHFVVCNLQSAVSKYNGVFPNLQNYTGLVANKLASRYGKTAVTYCSYQNEYKGSVRDPYSRVYLPIFQQLCYAGGHGPAFGLVIKPFELAEFLKRLETIDKYFHIKDVENEPIIIDHPYALPDEGLINDIAAYNEFSGNFLPVVYVRKQLLGAMKETQTSYYYKYNWGDYFIQSDFPITFGKYILIKPIQTSQVKLLAQV